MPIALQCTCGVRLEIDDKFAGQTITCPDCQRTLETLPSKTQGRRTNGLALASLILALVGAFTVVATVAAVGVGIVALLQIARNRDRAAGRGYAIAGIVIGAFMTAGTVFALSSFELFGWTDLINEGKWAGNLAFGGPLEVVRENEGFAITRPSSSWGVYKPPFGRISGDFNHSSWDDLILVQPSEDAVILCYAALVGNDSGIVTCQEKFVRDFGAMDDSRFTGKSTKKGGRTTPIVNDIKRPPKNGNVELVELRIAKRVSGVEQGFLVRILKHDDDNRMQVVVCGVRASRFHRLESQFREALDSVRLLKRNARRGW